MSHAVSQRRACTAIGIDRSSVRYRSRRPDDTALREQLRTLASERRRFGYRRLHIRAPARCTAEPDRLK